MSSDLKETLPRRLGIWGLWLLAVNGLIGAGIFGLPSIAAKLAGEYSPLIFLLCSLLIFPIVLCFAELSSYFHSTGGPVRYSKEAFGELIGFEVGWLYYISRVVAFAANSALLLDSIGYFWNDVADGVERIILLAFICGGLTFINVIGSVHAIRSLATLTIIKIAALFLLIIIGASQLGEEIIPEFKGAIPSANDIGLAALLLTYAYGGFELASIPAGESRNPTRHMPLALLLAIGGVAALYFFIQLVSLAAVPDIASSSTPLLDAANVLMGPVGLIFLILGIIASVGGNLAAGMFTAPRITYTLALDGVLPRWFGMVHEKLRTPANSIIFFGLLSFLLAIFGSFVWLAATSVFSRVLVYMLTCAAVPRLRARYSVNGGFVLPGGYLIPILGIGTSAWLMLQVSKDSFLFTMLLILVGSGFYIVARHQRIKET
jgi:amino acid transporter